MKKSNRVIAVDFDGVIAEFNKWKGIAHYGPPVKKIIEKLKSEKDKGTFIIIHTTRTSPDVNPGYTAKQLVDMLKTWLKDNDVPFDDIWAGIGKPIADEYWDDRAVRITKSMKYDKNDFPRY